MNTEFIDILDTALEQLRMKEPLSQILERYPDRAGDLVSLLQTAQALKSVQPVELPSSDAMQMDRKEFLQKIKQSESTTVSPGILARIKEWTGTLINHTQISLFYPRKEKWNMSSVLVRAALVIGLLFGATSGVYAMTENSLPNEPMYGAKLAMEQIRLNMVSDPTGIAVRHMVMAQNRAHEIVRLAQKGTLPDTGTMTRLETHLNTTLHFAAQVQNESELVGILTQARNMVQEQLQTMNQFQLNGDDSVQEGLRLTLRLLHQFQNQVETGLQNTNAFRLRYRNQNQLGEGVPGSSDCPNCPCEGCEPAGAQNQVQNQNQNQNQIGEGVPGNADCPNCPCDGCDPDGAQNQYQYQNGQQTGNDTSASQTKDSDCPNCPCVDCDGDQDRDRDRDKDQDKDQDRDRDQSCDNPQPGQPQPGECPNCPCEDCVPEGDQNQNGGKP